MTKDVQFEKKLVGITHDQTGFVTASFSDGSQESGHLLVGCDGSRSKVREFLVGEKLAKPSDIGMTMINHTAEGYTGEEALLLRKYHQIGKIAYHPDYYGNFLLTGTYGRVFPSSSKLKSQRKKRKRGERLTEWVKNTALDCSNLEKPEKWKFQVLHTWWGPPHVEDLKNPKTRLQFLKNRCSKLCEPFRTAGVALKDDVVLPIDPSQQWAPIEWDNRSGTVTLAGDSSHSMVPRE